MGNFSLDKVINTITVAGSPAVTYNVYAVFPLIFIVHLMYIKGGAGFLPRCDSEVKPRHSPLSLPLEVMQKATVTLYIVIK